MQSLRDIASDILRTIEHIARESEAPIDLLLIADLRKKVALAHNLFFAEQERLVLQPLRQSGDPALAEIARCSVERDLEGRRMGLAHYQRWPLARVAEDPAGYRREVLTMLRWIEARVLYAEQTAYPALARLISSPKQAARR